MTTKKPPGKPWAKGVSGNPAGRPPNQSKIHKWREALAGDVPEILAALVAQAKAGDPMAARLILDRALPALKPSELATVIDMQGETLTEQGKAVLAAVGAGELAPSQGAALIGAIAGLARVAEIDELSARITRLEEKQNAKS